MKTIKSVLYILIFLLIAAGFFALIRFEIQYGVAGGKFGGADKATMPGTFWFLIWMQTLLGLYLITDSIKEIWILFHGNSKEGNHNKPERIIAIYWLLAISFFAFLNLLAVWSAVEMLSNAYKLLDEFEMPKKAIFAGLFLIGFVILCSIYYNFLLRNLIETFNEKARISFRTLRKTKS